MVKSNIDSASTYVDVGTFVGRVGVHGFPDKWLKAPCKRAAKTFVEAMLLGPRPEVWRVYRIDAHQAA